MIFANTPEGEIAAAMQRWLERNQDHWLWEAIVSNSDAMLFQMGMDEELYEQMDAEEWLIRSGHPTEFVPGVDIWPIAFSILTLRIRLSRLP